MTDLINALIQEGLITHENVRDAQDKQLGAKKPLQELLVEMGFISEEKLIEVASKTFATPLADVQETIDPAVSRLIPFELARRFGVFPLRMQERKLILAMSNPVDVMAIDGISSLTGLQVEPVLATRSRIMQMTEENYHIDDTVYDLLKNTSSDFKVSVLKEDVADVQALESASKEKEDSSLVKLVNLILGDAIKMRASDIHIEPQDTFAAVRYRIDGNLKNIMNVPSELQPRLVARIKILAGLDVAERMKAQDGRIKILIGEHKVDLRINTVPTFYGETIALRLLDHQAANVDLNKIGLEPEELGKFSKAVKRPQGIILVTGPTGSGKTSTLYAALNFVKSETKHVITIEDPIEYLIEGINQIQLNPAKEMTFATSLRSILRQDPNIVLIGEIRDRETAEIAFQASQTGHLVLSTLHTMNSVSSITRLVDIGLEPFLIASSLIMVVAQRLVRLICPFCKGEYTPDAGEQEKFHSVIERFGLNKFYRGKGCQQCNFTGYLGRKAVFEIMEVNDAICALINSKAPESAILQEAQRNGLRTLADSAVRKVADGLTTWEEISRVVDISKQETAVQKQEIPGGAVKILIVDDEPDLLQILEKRLRDSGYVIVQGHDGAEAVEMAHKERPDLIIMDINMPAMDGFQATKALRSTLATASIPIMLLTARQDVASEVAGLDAGADDYMVKPYDKDKLLARVKLLLRKK
ncbi:MAG: ATPase, T2SS/T4P/T4SS family [Candidatus Omnitrophica bacterium]|nr:ATPase, T2SS/T4P/T4SS family [Candidatus Omnitrophota bacterium]